MNAYTLARRFAGEVHELPGNKDHPLIQWWLYLCSYGYDAHDEVPWCSAFVNGIAWELRLDRSKSAAARSWLNVGKTVPFKDAEIGNHVVVLKRGTGNQGHVGFFAGWSPGKVLVLGGNQSNQITIAAYPLDDVLGIRDIG